jgi:exodeoxyribonuclease-3
MQEVKLQKPILKGAEDLFQRFSFHEFHLSIARKGYSGVAVFAKEAPNEFFCGFAPGISLDDTEGRLMTLAYDDFTLVNIYVPNSGVQLQRLGYRTEAWDKGFQEHLKTLRSMYNRPLVVCGDFNVARTAIDLNDPFNNERSACYTIEERNNFELLLSETGLVDAYRFLNGNVRGQYTYWSYRGRSRQRNNGWRIDYFLVDASLIHPEESECIILKDVLGSDHAPVMFTLQG